MSAAPAAPEVASKAADALRLDVAEERPRVVTSRFELAALRLTAAWLGAGRVEATAHDLRLAREFLEGVGCTLQELPGLLVRLRHRDGTSEEMTREAAVMVALRRLAARRINERARTCEDACPSGSPS